MGNYSGSLDSAFNALSDPTRRAMVSRLIECDATVKELAEPFSVGLPTILKHLKVLEDSGLVSSRKVGRVRTCSIEAKRLTEVEKWISHRLKQWESRIDRFTHYVETLHNSKAKT